MSISTENGIEPKKSHEIAWALYLKAAKLGSPEAQMALADAYARVRRLNEGDLMLRCAYKQGFGPAATQLASIAGSIPFRVEFDFRLHAG